MVTVSEITKTKPEVGLVHALGLLFIALSSIYGRNLEFAAWRNHFMLICIESFACIS